MPKKLRATIFTEVIPQMIPEIDFCELAKLGAIVRSKDRVQADYDSLKSSLRKIQWVKFVGLKAIAIEQDIKKQMVPHVVLMDPIGQIDHSLSITDCLIHTKSAIDSMAIFLTDLLKIDAKGARRDLKRSDFRQQVERKDSTLRRIIKQLEPWLVYLQKVRDECIHRSSIRSFVVSGPSDVGVLPIPKNPSLVGKLPPKNMPITSRNFWSTEDFVNYHYSNLVTLFKAIVKRSIQIEEGDLQGPSPVLDPAEKKLICEGLFFPTRVTKKMTVRKMRVSAINLSAYFQRLSELFR